MRIKASANSNERAYRLYNQCAKREILIQDNNRVTATATNFDDKGKNKPTNVLHSLQAFPMYSVNYK